MPIEREVYYKLTIPAFLTDLNKGTIGSGCQVTLDDSAIKSLHRNLLGWAAEIAKAAGIFDAAAPTQSTKAPYGSVLQKDILAWVNKQNRALTASEVSVHFHISAKAAEKHLEVLARQKQLERVGNQPVKYLAMPSPLIVNNHKESEPS